MILYITRKFPPSIGGMQRFNKKLIHHLEPLTKITLIRWGGSQIVLPFFLIYALIKALILNLTRPIQCIYVSDALLSPLGYLLKFLTGKPVAVTVHGRDVAFSMRFYQMILRFSLRRLDRVICVSQALKTECLKRGVDETRVSVISNGIDVDDFEPTPGEDIQGKFESFFQRPLGNQKILLTVGRLVPKKGVDHFVKTILPQVISECPDTLYCIVGDGPLKEKIQSIISEVRLSDHVLMPGALPMESPLLKKIYHLADIFVMPNRPVDGDKEGFGIVALEACAAGLPVIASQVDGITEAVQHEKNGFLVAHDDDVEFTRRIVHWLKNDAQRRESGKKARLYVREHYSWMDIAQKYLSVFESMY